MTNKAQTVTAEQLLRMPDDSFRYELVRGELRRRPLAGCVEARIAARFGWRVAQHVKAHDLGVVYAAGPGFLLAVDPDVVRAPDVAFVRKERLELANQETGYLPGAPDLAVEVISPGDTYAEVEEKVIAWLEAGTRMVMAVDLRTRTVTRYRGLEDISILTEKDVIDGEDVVPGWSMPVVELFA
jgi:Uma2 family endonuclease